MTSWGWTETNGLVGQDLVLLLSYRDAHVAEKENDIITELGMAESYLAGIVTEAKMASYTSAEMEDLALLPGWSSRWCLELFSRINGWDVL